MIGGNIISQNTYMLSTAKYSYLRDIVTCEDSGINPFEMKYQDITKKFSMYDIDHYKKTGIKKIAKGIIGENGWLIPNSY